MKIYDESLYCQECGCEISAAQSKFCNDYCDDCYELTERKAEQEMQTLDQAVDPDGLDKSGQEAWDEYESEEFGTPNTAYCNSLEQDHNGGWFCHHPECVTSPDEDERLESSAQRFMESQADQDYWARRAAKGYESWQDHSPTCNCPECS